MIALPLSHLQVAQYQIQVVYTLSKMMGYQVLSSTHSSTSQHTEIFGTSPSILISSPDGTR